MVGINEGFMNAPEAPFGGIKESGLGRENSSVALDEFSEIKYICWGVEDWNKLLIPLIVQFPSFKARSTLDVHSPA